MDVSRRRFCAGGLAVLAAGCGGEMTRIETGGIDNEPGTLAGGTTGGGTTGGGTTGGGTTGGGTTGGGGNVCGAVMTNVGSVSTVAMGQAKRVRSGSVDAWLCHDAGGYYALDNYCPHRGCTVSFKSAGSFYCGCHGATFNLDGDRTNTRSPLPMDHLLLCVDKSGNAWIDPSQTVDAQTRV